MDLSPYPHIKTVRRNGRKYPYHQIPCQICGKELILDRYWIRRQVKRNRLIQCRPCSKTIHGGAGSFLYDRWIQMIRRCYDPRAEDYLRYGARGVKVCDEWRQDFNAFRSWFQDQGGDESMYIDKDVLGNGLLYSPETCCLVTPAVNAAYRKDKVFCSYQGVSHNTTYWEKHSPVGAATIRWRLKQGWTDKEAIFTLPYKPRGTYQ